MDQPSRKTILEAALMAAESPLNIERLRGLFADEGEAAPGKDDLRGWLEELVADYDGRGVELREVAGGWRFQTRAECAPWVNRLWEERKPRYSRALLETLAIMAYRQPITRAEIEDIRGVAVSSGIIKTLHEREWIKVVGHRDVPGRPAIYATTREFLDYFNLSSLADLPTLAELRDIDELSPDLFADFEAQAAAAEAEVPRGEADEAPTHESAAAEGTTVLEDTAASEASDMPEATDAADPTDPTDTAAATDDTRPPAAPGDSL